MASFKDCKGRDWHLKITYGLAKRVEKVLKIDLAKLLHNRLEKLVEVLTDLEKLVQVVWSLVEADADKQKVTPEEFAEGLDGEAILAMEAAFWEAVADFFPDRRQAILRVRAKALELARLKMDKEVTKAEGLTLDEAEKLIAASAAKKSSA